MAALLLALAMLATACSEKGTPEVPQEPNTPENPNTPNNPDDNEEPEPEKPETEEPTHPELPEATYAIDENIEGYVRTFETNGLRNDYVSFYEPISDHTLFIDFYSPIEGDYLPSGHYPLGDGSSMTSAQEYTYITLETGADFIAFSDGSATVTARHDKATGVTTHKVTAYYTMVTGETVSLQYEGVLTIKSGI